MSADALDLDALESLEAAATKGPWEAGVERVWSTQMSPRDETVGHLDRPADRDLIVALRNAAPALIAAARDRDGAVRALSDHRCDEQAERAYARATRAEAALDVALAALARVRAQHFPVDGVYADASTVCGNRYCRDDATDQFAWPCPTIRAIADEGQEDDRD